LPLTNKELAELDRQTHKEAQDNLDDEILVSGENTLTIERFKTNLQEINEAVDNFGTMILSHSAKVECELEDVLSCYKEI
jgi:hypothetical protein